MALHDSTSYILFPGDAAPALPDPATVGGRCHLLVNASNAAVAWTATGATPFLVAGAPAATLPIAAGDVRWVQSDGTHWVVAAGPVGPQGPAGPAGATGATGATGPAGPGLKSVRASGVTDASGNVTFSLAAASFAAVPVVSHSLQTALADTTEARITALTAASVTFNVRRSPAVTVLGIAVLSAPQPASGVTVHMHALEAGAQA